jgi:hypothetical protein
MGKQIVLSLPLGKNVIEMAFKCFVLISMIIYTIVYLCVFSTPNKQGQDILAMLLMSEYS